PSGSQTKKSGGAVHAGTGCCHADDIPGLHLPAFARLAERDRQRRSGNVSLFIAADGRTIEHAERVDCGKRSVAENVLCKETLHLLCPNSTTRQHFFDRRSDVRDPFAADAFSVELRIVLSKRQVGAQKARRRTSACG